MVALKRAPFTPTAQSVWAERMKAASTPRMVSVCASRRPIQLPPKVVPNRPASRAPASGASGTASSVDALRVVLIVSWGASGGRSPFQGVQFFDVDVRLVAEQQHQNGQADGGLRRRHR